MLLSDPVPNDIGIGLLYDPEVVHITLVSHIRTPPLTLNESVRGIHCLLTVDSNTPSISLFLVHWPSRTMEEQSVDRMQHGFTIRRLVDTQIEGTEPAFVIVCGDFNDDPCDPSMTNAMLATRDRVLASSRPRLLYNPFWRHLGEHSPFDRPVTSAAGTCYWKKGKYTKWHTFDQMIFTSSFLRNTQWRLVESMTEIWNRPPLARADGGIIDGFDHFPIISAVQQAEAA